MTAQIYGLWLLLFIVVKTGGVAFAAWSWWWVLCPVVPDVVLICQKLGFL